jgi:hypothetical protein
MMRAEIIYGAQALLSNFILPRIDAGAKAYAKGARSGKKCNLQ